MPYSGGSPLRRAVEARLRQRCPAEQVANAPDDSVDLTPASEAPLASLRAKFAPLVSGQAVPLLWERVPPEDPDDC